MIKRVIICGLAVLFGASTLADNHAANPQGNGAFTTLFVAAKDPESYIASVKSNPALFEMIGADAAGYCATISAMTIWGR